MIDFSDFARGGTAPTNPASNKYKNELKKFALLNSNVATGENPHNRFNPPPNNSNPRPKTGGTEFNNIAGLNSTLRYSYNTGRVGVTRSTSEPENSSSSSNAKEQDDDEYVKAMESFQAAVDNWSSQQQQQEKDGLQMADNFVMGSNATMSGNEGNFTLKSLFNPGQNQKRPESRNKISKDPKKTINFPLSAYTQNVPNLVMQPPKKSNRSNTLSNASPTPKQKDSKLNSSNHIKDLRAAYGADILTSSFEKNNSNKNAPKTSMPINSNKLSNDDSPFNSQQLEVALQTMAITKTLKGAVKSVVNDSIEASHSNAKADPSVSPSKSDEVESLSSLNIVINDLKLAAPGGDHPSPVSDRRQRRNKKVFGSKNAINSGNLSPSGYRNAPDFVADDDDDIIFDEEELINSLQHNFNSRRKSQVTSLDKAESAGVDINESDVSIDDNLFADIEVQHSQKQYSNPNTPKSAPNRMANYLTDQVAESPQQNMSSMRPQSRKLYLGHDNAVSNTGIDTRKKVHATATTSQSVPGQVMESPTNIHLKPSAPRSANARTSGRNSLNSPDLLSPSGRARAINAAVSEDSSELFQGMVDHGTGSSSSGSGHNSNRNTIGSASPNKLNKNHLLHSSLQRMSSFNGLTSSKPWSEEDHLPVRRPPSRQKTAFPIHLADEPSSESSQIMDARHQNEDINLQQNRQVEENNEGNDEIGRHSSSNRYNGGSVRRKTFENNPSQPDLTPQDSSTSNYKIPVSEDKEKESESNRLANTTQSPPDTSPFNFTASTQNLHNQRPPSRQKIGAQHLFDETNTFNGENSGSEKHSFVENYVNETRECGTAPNAFMNSINTSKSPGGVNPNSMHSIGSNVNQPRLRSASAASSTGQSDTYPTPQRDHRMNLSAVKANYIPIIYYDSINPSTGSSGGQLLEDNITKLQDVSSASLLVLLANGNTTSSHSSSNSTSFRNKSASQSRNASVYTASSSNRHGKNLNGERGYNPNYHPKDDGFAELDESNGIVPFSISVNYGAEESIDYFNMNEDNSLDSQHQVILNRNKSQAAPSSSNTNAAVGYSNATLYSRSAGTMGEGGIGTVSTSELRSSISSVNIGMHRNVSGSLAHGNAGTGNSSSGVRRPQNPSLKSGWIGSDTATDGQFMDTKSRSYRNLSKSGPSSNALSNLIPDRRDHHSVDLDDEVTVMTENSGGYDMMDEADGPLSMQSITLESSLGEDFLSLFAPGR